MTTMFLATTGGHLAQLADLAPRLSTDGHAFWVTHENEQSRSLLGGRDVVYVPYVRVRNIRDVVDSVPIAHRLWRERNVTRAISTGSGIALGYLPYLTARGVDCHYIESAARVGAPSLTGRLLQRMPRVKRYTQYARWAGPRWAYRGSIFDSFEPMRQPRRIGSVVRVVVTVGTAAEFPFARLIRQLVPLLSANGDLSAAVHRPVDVLWQTGCTPVDALSIEPVPFLRSDQLTEAIRAADIVVSHAGTGSALCSLKAGRCPLLASRAARRGEAGDDHQADLADELHARGLALHRPPTAITVDDLLHILDVTVRRRRQTPAFELL
jgi:UDP-N-acetylglucosamine--N-acetylmuramyl-(pentapeptide) pyrophosphoryl-undecaprenol N-acetylglucosamine transferase